MLAHWDDVEARERDQGHLRGTWYDLGRAAGTVNCGLKRIRVHPGGWSTPAHVHGASEEIFFVLGGSGLSWQDGTTHEVGRGDCMVHLREGAAHTLLAGPEGLDVIVFGPRIYDEASLLPRAGMFWLAAGWVRAGGEEDMPWKREVAAGPPDLPDAPSQRPPTIVNLADVQREVEDRAGFAGEWRDLGRTAGSELTGVSWVRVEPGSLSAPAHCHSAEEEIFVILDGTGMLELTPSPRPAAEGAQPARHEVRAGHVVARPAGSRISHAFRGGPEGMTMLAYGTREPNDIAYYPRSNKVNFRGIGLMARLEHLDYWDGE